MYSYKVKNEIEERIKANEDLEQISKDTQISISTLNKWKKEIEIRKKAKRLIKEGNIEEARIEINKLSPKSNRIVILSLEMLIAKQKGNQEEEKELLEKILKVENDNVQVMISLIGIAIKEKNRNREKELSEKILEIEPNNVIAMYTLTKIAREEKNRNREKELLEKILNVDPDNARTMINLIIIARKEQNKKREKELLEKILKLEPNNVITIYSLIRIAKEERNKDREKELLEKVLKIEPDNVKAMNSLRSIAEEERNKDRKKEPIVRVESIKLDETEDDFEEIFTEKNKELDAIGKARKLIEKSDSKDMLNKIEAAFKAKIYKHSEGYLKLHKKELKEDKIALDTINKALRIVQTRNKLYDPLKWKRIYNEYKKARNIQNTEKTTNDKKIDLDDQEI